MTAYIAPDATMALRLQARLRVIPQQRIATLTVNPALDVSTAVPHVVPDHKLRCTELVRQPGGGGVNVARAIRRLHGDATACFPVDGPSSDLMMSLLEAEGVPRCVVRVRGPIRENLNVIESTSGRQFRFCMPGPTLAEGEWNALLDAFAALGPELAVLSGSLAPGVPPDFYARATEMLGRRGARVVLDASGEALARCARKGVFLLKASVREFETLVGATGLDDARLGELAAQTVAGGMCDVLVVSLGARGALWTTKGQQGRLTAPSVPVRSTVGAGDSMVAGIVLALARGRTLRDAMRYGVAAGSATVMQHGTALCQYEDVDRMFAQITEQLLP